MSVPHDFYKYDPDHPELHNRGEGRHYLEPDWHATHMDAQLPALSAIGRGPRGEGLFVGATVNQDGEISFTLNSTLTGEVVWESPNLAPPEIEFNTVSWRDLVPGVAAPLDITVKRGGVTKTTKAWLPAGQVGSLVYLLGGDPVQVRSDHTYTTTVADLTIFGKKQYQNKPVPRPNDVVMFQYADGDDYGLGVGIVENVGGTTRENYGGGDIPTPTNVVYTCNIYIPFKDSSFNRAGSFVFYGESDSFTEGGPGAIGTMICNVSCAELTEDHLEDGTVLNVYFDYPNYNSSSIVLKINDLDEMFVNANGSEQPYWDSGKIITFVYRNRNWYTNPVFGG